MLLGIALQSWISFGPAMEVISARKFSHRPLAQVMSCRSLWLGLFPSVFTPYIFSCGGHCLRPALVEVAGSDLLCWSHWLEPIPMVVLGWGLLLQSIGLIPWWLLPHTCSCGGHLEGPAPGDLLAWACPHGDPWHRPGNMKASGSGLFWWRF